MFSKHLDVTFLIFVGPLSIQLRIWVGPTSGACIRQLLLLQYFDGRNNVLKLTEDGTELVKKLEEPNE